MYLAIFFTVLLFPVYWIIRSLFFDLPLHRDTGFYVSNDTILNQKFSYRNGWNAQYALCSKWLPEYFYSLVYLKFGGSDYVRYSRIIYSIYNYTTGIVVGLCAWRLGGHDWTLYAYGLSCYVLLTSQPCMGVYFESAEQFEGLFQAISFLLIYLGYQEQADSFIFFGLALLLLESIFIKTASLITASVVTLALLIANFSFLSIILYAYICSGLIFLFWLLRNQVGLRELMKSGAKHESYWLGMSHFKSKFGLILKKLWFTVRCTLHDFPIFFIFFAFGLLRQNPASNFLLIYLAVTLLTCLIQSARIWYFFIPVTIPISLVAAFGVQQWSVLHGWLMPGILAVAWLVYMFITYRGSRRDLNLRVWKPYGSHMANQNFLLSEFASKIKFAARKNRLFVYGVTNQIYAMLDTSYPTNLVCGAAWLDYMVPDWQGRLNREFVQNPPQFLFSSDDFLNLSALETELGLKYELISEFSGNLRLYQFNSRLDVSSPNLKCAPYQSAKAHTARAEGIY